MRSSKLIVAVVAVALIGVLWFLDRSSLRSEIMRLERDLAQEEIRQDKAEFEVFNGLEIGQSIESTPEVLGMADDVIRPGHDAFDDCCKIIAEQFSDTSDTYRDCEILVFNVSRDAVPFHGGSYWIVTRENQILLAFQVEAAIGG